MPSPPKLSFLLIPSKHQKTPKQPSIMDLAPVQSSENPFQTLANPSPSIQHEANNNQQIQLLGNPFQTAANQPQQQAQAEHQTSEYNRDSVSTQLTFIPIPPPLGGNLFLNAHRPFYPLYDGNNRPSFHHASRTRPKPIGQTPINYDIIDLETKLCFF